MLKSISHVLNCAEITINRNYIIWSALTVNNVILMQGKTLQFVMSWFCVTNSLHILRLNVSLHRYSVEHCQFSEGCLVHTELQMLGVSLIVNTINLRCAYHQIVVCLNTGAWLPSKMPCLVDIRLTKHHCRLIFLVILTSVLTMAL